jgi:hypothetical protein
MAQNPGFEIIQCEAPSEELRVAAKAETEKDVGACLKTSEARGYVLIKTGEKCLELFRYGWNVSSIDLLGNSQSPDMIQRKERLLQCKLDETATRLRALIFLQNEKKLPPYRAAPGHLVFYRPLSGILETKNGLFKIYPGSHKLDGKPDSESDSKPDSKQVVQPIEITLQPDEVLMIDGNIVIEYPCDGGGVGLMEVWKMP